MVSKDYESTMLNEDDLPSQPLEAFDRWFKFAKDQKVPQYESFTLATADSRGRPSARIVLYKGRVNDAFTFFTNYDSRKSREIIANPHVAMVFHWAELERQVRIEGTIKKTSRAESVKYFETRPRGSQIGAWASMQSMKLDSREILDEHVSEVEERFRNKPVPCPENWGGFEIHPEVVEFWQGMTSRLHDRFRYSKTPSGWKWERLNP